MLMARDTARDEAQKLHRKWLKHQAFMAELARNKEWLAKIEQYFISQSGIKHPNIWCLSLEALVSEATIISEQKNIPEARADFKGVERRKHRQQMTIEHTEGQELIQEKPELRPVVQQKLEEIRECWSDLETTTKAKARQLFENNKPEPAVKSYSDLDNQLSHLEQQPPQLEQAHHLPTFNEQLQKFQASLQVRQPVT
ncbi:hypothetical protein INR49_030042 [Caranx melampygus]|nr:hypothetical protein INR49_030042 [Caranx melampygus]